MPDRYAAKVDDRYTPTLEIERANPEDTSALGSPRSPHASSNLDVSSNLVQAPASSMYENIMFSDEDDSLMRALDCIPTNSSIATAQPSIQSPQNNEKKILGERQKNILKPKPILSINTKLSPESTKQTSASQNYHQAEVQDTIPISLSEELTLLAVKNKPNSPDHDSDAAPAPPRSTHKRAAVTKTPWIVERVLSMENSVDQDENDPKDSEHAPLHKPSDSQAPDKSRSIHGITSTLFSKDAESNAVALKKNLRPVRDGPQRSGVRDINSSMVSLNTSVGLNSLESKRVRGLAAQQRDKKLVSLAEKNIQSSDILQSYSSYSVSPREPQAKMVRSNILQAKKKPNLDDDPTLNDDDSLQYPVTYLQGPRSGQLDPLVIDKSYSSTGVEGSAASTFSSAKTGDTDQPRLSTDISEQDSQSQTSSAQSLQSQTSSVQSLQSSVKRGESIQSTQSGETSNDSQSDGFHSSSDHSGFFSAPERLQEAQRMAAVVSGQANLQVFQSPRNNSKIRTIAGVTICILILGGVAALVYFFAIREKGVEADPLELVASNTECSSAISVSSAGGDPLRGEILENAQGSLDFPCMVQQSGGHTLWYHIEGDGSYMTASTCETTVSSSELDTQVLVFAGNCEALQCIGGSDQLCDAHGSVGWQTQEGEPYHIVVKGYDRSAFGTFSLSLNQSASNTRCSQAIDIDGSISTIFGSTRNRTSDTTFPPCDSTSEVAASMWYRLGGRDALVSVSLSLEEDNVFSSTLELAVYEGSECNRLNCVLNVLPTRGDSHSFTFVSREESTYYIVVKDFGLGNVHDFLLHTSTLPSNSMCQTGKVIATGNGATNGTVKNARSSVLPECSGVSNTPVVWYVVFGTGGLLVADVTGLSCDNSESAIYVFDGKNGCSNLECVEYTSFNCIAAASPLRIQWPSKAGALYYVAVATHNGDITANDGTNDFEIKLTPGELEVSNDYCSGAEPVAIPSVTYGSTVGATSVLIESCPMIASTAGVWYTLIGNGSLVTASLCGDATNFDTQVFLFSGEECSELKCVDSNEDYCGNKSLVSWSAQTNVRYYILVSGFGDTTGDLELVIS